MRRIVKLTDNTYQGAYCDHECDLGSEETRDVRKHLRKNPKHAVGMVYEKIVWYYGPDTETGRA